MSTPLPLWQQYQRWCIHYRGTIGPGMKRFDTCKAGFAYADATDDQGRMVCISGGRAGKPQQCAVTCPQATFLTDAEAQQKEADANARLLQYFADIVDNICPNHKQPITLRQVGRCVYAEPCGCHLYQGRLPKQQGGHA